MKSIIALAKSVKAKTQKMLHLQEALQKENLRLHEQITRLKNRADELEKLNKKIEDQNNVLKISKNISGDNEKNSALKLRINELVREIDKCIAQLNR
ncbi:MAG: hypothetical protein HY064_09220 [Bacteroidetes bacterium]|nr:hypothetical protein [Bacteroidota bacterium]